MPNLGDVIMIRVATDKNVSNDNDDNEVVEYSTKSNMNIVLAATAMSRVHAESSFTSLNTTHRLLAVMNS